MNEQNAAQGNEASPEQNETSQHVTQAVREVLHEKYDDDMRARAADARRARWMTSVGVVAGTALSALLVLAARSSSERRALRRGSASAGVDGRTGHALDALAADFEARLASQQQALNELDALVDAQFSRRRKRRGSARSLLAVVVGALIASRLPAVGQGASATE